LHLPHELLSVKTNDKTNIFSVRGTQTRAGIWILLVVGPTNNIQRATTRTHADLLAILVAHRSIAVVESMLSLHGLELENLFVRYASKFFGPFQLPFNFVQGQQGLFVLFVVIVVVVCLVLFVVAWIVVVVRIVSLGFLVG